MRKCFAWMLLLCLVVFVPAGAEDVYGSAVPGAEAELAEVFERADAAPFIPENMEKAVFGSDDRTTINQPGKYPYSAIAYMKVKAKCGCSWTGSGFLVGKAGLVTAAHCLVCEEHEQYAEGITMYFGYKSDKNYSYCYTEGTTFWLGAIPYEDGKYIADDDYAYLKLQKNVGEQVGWFGTRSAYEAQDGQVYNVAGYRHGALKTSSGRVTIRSEKMFNYQTDTEPGYSGCPIFDDEYYTVGINVGHNSTTNLGRRFTQDFWDAMKANGILE